MSADAAAPPESPSLESPSLEEASLETSPPEASSERAALEERVAALEARLAELETLGSSPKVQRITLIVHSGDMDRLMAAFIVATGGRAMGFEVSMFFTFWGLTSLKECTLYRGKSLAERMVALLLPGGPASVGTSRLNMLGMGPAFFRSLMANHNVESLGDLISLARELEVRMVACQMSMGIMGIVHEELIEGVELGGVATYLNDAAESQITLFL